MSKRQPYPSDVSDAEWRLIKDLIPPGKPGGRKRKVNEREVVNAILYVNATKCPWRYLPHDYPPWGTVYHYFGKWQTTGTLERICDELGRQTAF